MTRTDLAARLPESYLELSARERTRRLFDNGTFQEILGPYDRVSSTWLRSQGIVPQFDDGVVIALGSVDGQRTAIAALEGRFQGGSVGEVSGSKILAALQLTRRDCEQGVARAFIFLMDTGGVRLQEANLGLELIAEIHGEIVALRRLVPVISLIAGSVGCFGGMSIAAALCSYVMMTARGRYGLNGPEVIEQEAGTNELDSSDRAIVSAFIGGRQRVDTGFADTLLADDMSEIKTALAATVRKGLPARERSSEVNRYLALLRSPQAAAVWSPEDVLRVNALQQVPS